jgi:hypothetical protein
MIKDNLTQSCNRYSWLRSAPACFFIILNCVFFKFYCIVLCTCFNLLKVNCLLFKTLLGFETFENKHKVCKFTRKRKAPEWCINSSKSFYPGNINNNCPLMFKIRFFQQQTHTFTQIAFIKRAHKAT